MRTIQMTLDDDLVETVDKVVKKLKTTRSAFTRKALKNAIKQVNISMLEKKHKKGYDLSQDHPQIVTHSTQESIEGIPKDTFEEVTPQVSICAFR